jgi:L-ascorbate metabolism protein UlaG (beta-lactamase superfamily)
MFTGSRAARLLPVHHSTFPLGDEGAGEPMRRLLAAAGDQGHRVIVAEPGAVWAA